MFEDLIDTPPFPLEYRVNGKMSEPFMFVSLPSVLLHDVGCTGTDIFAFSYTPCDGIQKEE